MFLFLPLLLLLFVPISRGTTSPWCLNVQEVKAGNEMTTTIGIVFWQISKFLEDSGEFLLDLGHFTDGSSIFSEGARGRGEGRE